MAPHPEVSYGGSGTKRVALDAPNHRESIRPAGFKKSRRDMLRLQCSQMSDSDEEVGGTGDEAEEGTDREPSRNEGRYNTQVTTSYPPPAEDTDKSTLLYCKTQIDTLSKNLELMTERVKKLEDAACSPAGGQAKTRKRSTVEAEEIDGIVSPDVVDTVLVKAINEHCYFECVHRGRHVAEFFASMMYTVPFRPKSNIFDAGISKIYASYRLSGLQRFIEVLRTEHPVG